MTRLTRKQVRDLDGIAVRRFSIPGLILMENAGRGAVEVLVEHLAPAPDDLILVVAGAGNNGGDGFVMARHLVNRGHRVEIAVLGPRMALRGTGDAGVNFLITEKMEIPIHVTVEPGSLPLLLERTDVVVDALLGTGLAGTVRGRYADAIAAINDSRKPVFAVDVPSGLDCDTGLPLGDAVRAVATATFAAMKLGLEEECARAYCGHLEVVDIGAPVVWE